YRGVRDPARETRMLAYLITAVRVPGAQVRDWRFHERVLAPDLVEPDIVAAYDFEQKDASPDRHQMVATAVDLALSAANLTVIEMVLTATAVLSGRKALVGLLAGGMAGALAGRRVESADPATLGAVLGGILGALMGGAVGAGIAADAMTLGLWRKNQDGQWTLLPAAALLAGLPDFGAREV
ncbi:MAG: hypothetical protein ACP5QO_03130, partial [Clostridia bacterium]